LGAGFRFAPDEGLRSQDKGAGMDSAGEYRHRAIACLRLASEAAEPYVKVALTELAIEFSSMADSVETCGVDERRWKIS
jgi:predicted AAA+ superfamily ATPase